MDKSLILNNIKEYLNIRYDKEFAEYLSIKTTTLAMWYKRNTYDVELLFKKCEFLNSEWLLTGKGEMLKKQTLSIPTVTSEKDKLLIEMQTHRIRSLEKELQDQKQQIDQLKKELSLAPVAKRGDNYI